MNLVRRRAYAVLVACLSVGVVACATWGAPVLAVGNAVLQAAAINYGGDYAAQAQIIASGLGQASQLALATYLERERQSEQLALQQAAAEAAASAISLDVALLKRLVTPLGVRVEEIADGDVLRDGRGDPSRGDQLRVFFRANQECYVYVVAVDATGWMQPLHMPSGPQPNVAKGQTVVLPDDRHWFGLDENRGFEHFYFMASFDRQPRLEQTLASFASRTRPLPERPATVERAVIAEQAWIDARGPTAVGSGIEGQVMTRGESAARVLPTTFTFGVPGRDFVLTRVFEHR